MKKVDEETKKVDENFVKSEHCQEMTDAQREAIVYRSKLLNKYFEEYDDMLRAEAEFKRQNEAKLQKVEEKKTAAKKVEDAYKKALEVRKEAYKQIEDAENDFYKARQEFVDKYGSWHMTYTNENGEDKFYTSDTFNWVNEVMKDFFGW